MSRTSKFAASATYVAKLHANLDERSRSQEYLQARRVAESRKRDLAANDALYAAAKEARAWPASARKREHGGDADVLSNLGREIVVLARECCSGASGVSGPASSSRPATRSGPSSPTRPRAFVRRRARRPRRSARPRRASRSGSRTRTRSRRTTSSTPTSGPARPRDSRRSSTSWLAARAARFRASIERVLLRGRDPRTRRSSSSPSRTGPRVAADERGAAEFPKRHGESGGVAGRRAAAASTAAGRAAARPRGDRPRRGPRGAGRRLRRPCARADRGRPGQGQEGSARRRAAHVRALCGAGRGPLRPARRDAAGPRGRAPPRSSPAAATSDGRGAPALTGLRQRLPPARQGPRRRQPGRGHGPGRRPRCAPPTRHPSPDDKAFAARLRSPAGRSGPGARLESGWGLAVLLQASTWAYFCHLCVKGPFLVLFPDCSP